MLEYGRHDLDEGYEEVELEFSRVAEDVQEGEMRLASISVNLTHVTGRLQVCWPKIPARVDVALLGTSLLPSLEGGKRMRGQLQAANGAVEEVAAALIAVPTDCPGNEMQVGDQELILASLKFDPRWLTHEQVANPATPSPLPDHDPQS